MKPGLSDFMVVRCKGIEFSLILVPTFSRDSEVFSLKNILFFGTIK